MDPSLPVMNTSLPVWIAGATGRIGRAVADLLARRGTALTLVGRDAEALDALADGLEGTPSVVRVGSVSDLLGVLPAHDQVVLVNLVGPFAESALPTVRACAPGSHYVDLANDLPSVTALLGAHDAAVAAGRCLVTGAGFGVLGCESTAMRLCEGWPAPTRVRVDAVPFIDSPGPIGRVVAATVVDALGTPGRVVERGQFVRAGTGSHAATLTLPDGTKARTGAAPSGDLVAVERATGAAAVVAASSIIPTSPVVRAVAPVLGRLASFPSGRRWLTGQFAKMPGSPATPPRPHSWVRARGEWADGTTRDAWLRAGEAMDFTARVAAEVAWRLSRGEGRAGAFTPGALFGATLAVTAGGAFLDADAVRNYPRA